MKTILLPSAIKEIEDIAFFYDYRSAGTGLAFTNEFWEALELIETFPTGFQEVGPNTRKCVLRKFPYLILFIIEEDHIVIAAVAHQHRHPRIYLR